MKKKINEGIKNYFKNIDWKEPKQMIIGILLLVMVAYIIKIVVSVVIPLLFIGLVAYAFVWVLKKRKKDGNA